MFRIKILFLVIIIIFSALLSHYLSVSFSFFRNLFLILSLNLSHFLIFSHFLILSDSLILLSFILSLSNILSASFLLFLYIFFSQSLSPFRSFSLFHSLSFSFSFSFSFSENHIILGQSVYIFYFFQHFKNYSVVYRTLLPPSRALHNPPSFHHHK